MSFESKWIDCIDCPLQAPSSDKVRNASPKEARSTSRQYHVVVVTCVYDVMHRGLWPPREGRAGV